MMTNMFKLSKQYFINSMITSKMMMNNIIMNMFQNKNIQKN